MTKLEATDTQAQMMDKIADMIPGAAMVLTHLVANERRWDPTAEGELLLHALAQHGIYGSRLWVLYQKTCAKNLLHLFALIRAMNLNLVDHDTVMLHCIRPVPVVSDPLRIDCAQVLKAVQRDVPGFGKEGVFEAEATRFQIPHGDMGPITTQLPVRVKAKYELMRKSGCRFTVERLNLGVNICIEHPKFGDLASRVVPNGPQVQSEMEGMLMAFTEESLDRFRAQVG